MSSPKLTTIKRLFAESGNQCAFPKCTTSIIDDSRGIVLGEICHIKAQKVNGPRYDENQTNEERHGFNNLILLCPLHHSIIDSDTKSYTVERLINMKSKHEDSNRNSQNEIEEKNIKILIDKIDISNKLKIKKNELNQINPVGNQFAKTIQNFNTPLGISIKLTYKDLLSELYSTQYTVSKLLADTIKVATETNDYELIHLCKNELTGWSSMTDNTPDYRIFEVYLSPVNIKSSSHQNINEMWQEFESRNEFVNKNIFFSDAVPLIEQMLEENKSHDSNKSFIHLVRNQEDMFPGSNMPDMSVHIYAKATMYYNLLNGIRNNLANEILKRIK